MNSSNYSDKQSARNAAYTREYEDWLRTLTPNERETLAAQGLDKPLIEERSTYGCGLDDDFANSKAASCEAVIPPDSAEPMPPLDMGGFSNEQLWDVLRRLIGEILTLPNRSRTARLPWNAWPSYQGSLMPATRWFPLLGATRSPAQL